MMDENLRKLQREAKDDPSARERLKTMDARLGIKPLTADEVAKKIQEITESDYNANYGYINETPHVEFRKIESESLGPGIEIRIERMYDGIELNFGTLKKISEFFGTDHIDVDNWARGGCESCDYGSSYGVEIQVYSPTKNAEFRESLE